MFPLEMGWRHLLFENYRVDREVVDDALPEPLEADVYDGSAWLSVIPFTNVAVRPKGVPRRLGVRLPELNVRTYVTVDGEPGVYFFSLDAEGVLAVVGARLFHRLPYYYARISLERVDEGFRFRCRRTNPRAESAVYRASYRPTSDEFQATGDDLAEFLVERYRLYTTGHTGGLRYTEVDHDEWTLQPAEAETQPTEVLAADGLPEPEGEPVLYYSDGLDVVASRSKRL